MKKIILSFLCCLISLSAFARIYIPVDQPSDKKLPIAITRLVPLDGGAGSLEKEIPNIIQKDLENSAYFQFIPSHAFLEEAGNTNIAQETINFDLWTAIEAQALIKGGISKKGDSVKVELRLFDPFLKETLVGKQYTASAKDVRAIAHRFADEVMLSLTGVKGPFNSKITYTAPMKKGNKAIFVMDYDGEKNSRITDPKTLSLGSKFSPDGSQVAFASYASGTPEIYVATLDGKAKQLTKNKSTNITPAFSPTGGGIVFSSSMKDDPDIWLMNLAGKITGRLTTTTGVDVSPVYSPDGSRILFASERAGKLHLFVMGADGGEATRLTFVGQFNDTPAWSPDGQKIAFCAMDQGAFDIFTMNSDGSFIQRLTSGEGDNTHPSWSPDGRYLTFSSTRNGGRAIYMMRFDGENPVRLSKSEGLLPWWGPRLP